MSTPARSPAGKSRLAASPHQPEKSYRSSHFSGPVLRFIAQHRIATVHQLLWVLWHADGRHSRHGTRVIGRLVAQGLLTSRPLDPQLGAVSRHVLTLAPRAREWTPPSLQHPDPWTEPRWMLEHRLARTQAAVLAGPRGWEWVSRRELGELLHRAGLDSYRGRALNGDDRDFQRRLANLGTIRLPCDGLVHRATGSVMPVLEVRPGLSLRGTIGRLPTHPLILAGRFQRFDVIVLGADPTAVAEARAALDRSIRHRQLPLTVRAISHYRELPHPREWPTATESLYTRHDLPSPLGYRRPARRVADGG